MIFRAVDLETNGVDVKTTEVAQVAIVSARAVEVQPPPRSVTVYATPDPATPLDPQPTFAPDMSARKTSKTLCRVSKMPKAATKVHGLTFEQLKDEPPFAAKVRGLLGALTKPDVVVVTFNGARFDLPVIARYAAAHGKLQSFIADVDSETAVLARDRFDELLNRQHIDVARVWQVARVRKIAPPWLAGLVEDAGGGPVLHAGMFAGKLEDVHGFWLGRGFEDAHEAAADCVATLAVLRAMIASGFVDVEKAIRWTREPLPGAVDFDGVFKWDGDQAICALKKFKDVPIEEVDRGFLGWMLEPARDFHRNTKHVVSEWLAGRYPIREYEKEDNT